MVIHRSGLPSESCYCSGNFPGCLALPIGAEPIECVPGGWPVLDEPVFDEQAPTNRPVSSSANGATDMVIFFFIYRFLLDATKLTTFSYTALRIELEMMRINSDLSGRGTQSV